MFLTWTISSSCEIWASNFSSDSRNSVPCADSSRDRKFSRSCSLRVLSSSLSSLALDSCSQRGFKTLRVTRTSHNWSEELNWTFVLRRNKSAFFIPRKADRGLIFSTEPRRSTIWNFNDFLPTAQKDRLCGSEIPLPPSSSPAATPWCAVLPPAARPRLPEGPPAAAALPQPFHFHFRSRGPTQTVVRRIADWVPRSSPRGHLRCSAWAPVTDWAHRDDEQRHSGGRSHWSEKEKVRFNVLIEKWQGWGMITHLHCVTFILTWNLYIWNQFMPILNNHRNKLDLWNMRQNEIYF